MTARLLLGRQLVALTDIDWTVVAGDAYEDAPPGLKVDLVPMRRELALSDPSSFLHLLRLFRRRRFDFVQTHTPKPSLLGLPAARLSGTPSIYTIHGSLFFRGNGMLANALGWCFERWCCMWATEVAVQSREDEDVLRKVGICPARKLSYIGNGISTEYFSTVVERADLPGDSSDALSRTHDAKADPDLPIVLMVSRLVREKGCGDFLVLARRFAGRARFVHVGPAEDDQSDSLSEDEVAQAAGVVTFVGEVADVRPYLAAADIVVLPSYREGIPRALMEAAAAGCPVVAYDIRGVREVVDPDAGLLAPRGDVSALGTLLAGLIDDPVRRRALGRRCQQWVLERFGEESVIDRLRVLYAQLPPRSQGWGVFPTAHRDVTSPSRSSDPEGDRP